MKKIILLLIWCLGPMIMATGQEQQAEKLLSKAVYQEEVNGNLQEAIRLYEEIVKKFPEYRSVVAKALYRNGYANEKLGNLKARQYYEKVINNYSDQPELVQLAQIRLNRMLKTEKPADVQVASLRLEDLSIINLYEKGSSIVKGTSLDNSSLSSDGTKMAGIDYSIGQNVAIYDLKTKQIQLITKYDWFTEGHGWTYFPAWSPDGKEIAYLFSDWKGSYELQVSSLEGKTRTLLKNESNTGQIIPRQWSRDGSNILTFKQDSSGFYTIGLVPAKGGSFTALYKTQWEGKFIKGDASLSPDGKFVVFADGQKDNLDLFIIDAEGGTPTELSGHPTNEIDPLWSPDGKHIAYIKETKGESFLYAIEMAEGKPAGQPFLIKEGMQNVDLINWTEHGVNYIVGLNLHDIYTLPLNPETGTPTGKPKPLDYTPTGSNTNPVRSHDGKYLAFISYADKPEVVILPANGEETRHYPIYAPGFWELSLHDLRWLPDNSGLGFNVLSPLEISTVYRLDLATGKWQNWPLPIKGWTRTDQGPDENSFIYDKRNVGLYQFNIKTGETRNIFQPDTSTWYIIKGLKFSRDHKKLTFMFQNTIKNTNLMVLDLESGESRMLAQNFWSPTFSPDGQKILTFGSSDMAVLSLDGKILHEFNLVKYFSPGTRISSFDWSPDGKQPVFMTRNIIFETYLMKNVLK